MPIVESQVSAAFEVSGQIYEGALSIQDGVKFLHEEHGLNKSSANDFIRNYKHMLRGETFHRTMSAPQFDFFLQSIRTRLGNDAHLLAMSAVRQHLAYYEGLRKVTQHRLRNVLARHAIDAMPSAQAELDQAFRSEVEASERDTPGQRKARLAKANKMPAKVLVTTVAYKRNPDVVVEVLRRANGRCERCQEAAPFIKRSDGTPYLEVHHKVQLSKDGEDTVENAEALCPNCHREQHFGA